MAAAFTEGIALRSGQNMPFVGLGTWKAEKGVVARVVEEAIKVGYRHIDCACDYGNEGEVGQGIKAAIDAGVCKREDLFITSKLWNTFHHKEHVRPACERTLKDLGLDYIDLYLIHFPICLKYVDPETRYPPEWFHDPSAASPKMELDLVPMSETWAAMEALVDAGLAKNIGVSNFSAQLLMDVMSYARIKPAVNQIEIHPYLTNEHMVRLCKKLGVVVTGYSPLGAGSYVALGVSEQESVLKTAIVTDIAQRLGKTPAQVVLRWAVQRGYNIVPKSSKVERLLENISVFDFTLTEDDMAKVSGLNCNRRFNDPGVYTDTAFNEYWPIFA